MKAASCSVFIKPITRHIFREEISAHMDLVPMPFYKIAVKMQDENYQKNTSKLLCVFFFLKLVITLRPLCTQHRASWKLGQQEPANEASHPLSSLCLA